MFTILTFVDHQPCSSAVILGWPISREHIFYNIKKVNYQIINTYIVVQYCIFSLMLKRGPDFSWKEQTFVKVIGVFQYFVTVKDKKI